MTKEYIVNKLNKTAEENITKASQIQRAGDLNSKSVEELTRLAERLHICLTEPSAEEVAYYEAKSLYEEIQGLGQIMAQDGEAPDIFAGMMTENLSGTEKDDIRRKIEGLSARLAEIEDDAKAYGKFLGVHYDGKLAK